MRIQFNVSLLYVLVRALRYTAIFVTTLKYNYMYHKKQKNRLKFIAFSDEQIKLFTTLLHTIYTYYLTLIQNLS